MVEWNPLLKAGLVGFAAVIALILWFIGRVLAKEKVPFLWMMGLFVLFLLSLGTTVGSQISKLSFGG